LPGAFVVTIWKDWLTAEVLNALNLNDRQKCAISAIRLQGRISNSEYQSLTDAARTTAKRDLEDLVKKGVLASGGKGRGAFYLYSKKRIINGPNGP